MTHTTQQQQQQQKGSPPPYRSAEVGLLFRELLTEVHEAVHDALALEVRRVRHAALGPS